MPVSIITSQARPGAICFQRATCSALLRHGRADRARPASTSSGPTPCSTTRLAPSGKRSERLRLGPGRNEKVAAARFEQRLGGLARAEAIAVGLDRRSRRNARALGKPAPIGLDCGTVEGQAQRRGAWAPFAVHPELSRDRLSFRREKRAALRQAQGERVSCGPDPSSPVELLDRQLDRLVEAIGVDAPRLRVRPRLIEALHPAMRGRTDARRRPSQSDSWSARRVPSPARIAHAVQ